MDNIIHVKFRETAFDEIIVVECNDCLNKTFLIRHDGESNMTLICSCCGLEANKFNWSPHGDEHG